MYQYDYWSGGRYLSYPIYNFYTTGRYYDESSKAVDCKLIGCVFYTPGTGEIPPPTEKWDDKPYVGGDLAFIRIPGIPGIKTASYTCLQPGDKVALEVQSDAVGTFYAIVLTKQKGGWVEVNNNAVTANGSASSGSAIVEYVVQDDDEELAFVAKLTVKAQTTDKENADGVAFLVDVGHSRMHLSMKTIGYVLGAGIAFAIVMSIVSVIKKKEK